MPQFAKLLTDTSRTFGLSIQLLDEPHRRRLTLAYLLFRVADTLEDAHHVPRQVRVAALRQLREAITSGTRDQRASLAEEWLSWRPADHTGYLALLRQFPALLAAIEDLGRPASSLIVDHACRTIDGMGQFVESSDAAGRLRLRTLNELRQYCYAVAGIVGELITDLLLAYVPCLAPVEGELRRDAAPFGEGLQLVNILKDAEDDVLHGRQFLPPDVPAEAIFELAERDLRRADRYLRCLSRCQADHGILAFVELPIRLAYRTLDRVHKSGAGAKLTRREVAGILGEIAGA